MTKTIHVWLDDQTYRLLKRLARKRGENKNIILRESLKRLAELNRIKARRSKKIASGLRPSQMTAPSPLTPVRTLPKGEGNKEAA